MVQKTLNGNQCPELTETRQGCNKGLLCRKCIGSFDILNDLKMEKSHTVYVSFT